MERKVVARLWTLNANPDPCLAVKTVTLTVQAVTSLFLLRRAQEICMNTTRKSRGQRLRLCVSLQVGNG